MDRPPLVIFAVKVMILQANRSGEDVTFDSAVKLGEMSTPRWIVGSNGTDLSYSLK